MTDWERTISYRRPAVVPTEIDREAIQSAPDVRELGIEKLGLPKRIFYTLQMRGVMTVGDLLDVVKTGRKVRGIGVAYTAKVVERLREAGLSG